MRVTGKGLSVTFEQEIPSGTVNGSNVTFTLSQTPYSAKNVHLFLDSRPLVFTTEWSISGVTITMVTAPAVGQQLYAYYMRAS